MLPIPLCDFPADTYVQDMFHTLTADVANGIAAIERYLELTDRPV